VNGVIACIGLTPNYCLALRMRNPGLEPGRLAPHEPESCASTNSASSALVTNYYYGVCSSVCQVFWEIFFFFWAPLIKGARLGGFIRAENRDFDSCSAPVPTPLHRRAVSFSKKRGLCRGSATLLPVPTPPPTIFRHFRHWGNHGGIAPTKNETALPSTEARMGVSDQAGRPGARPRSENETALGSRGGSSWQQTGKYRL
jgi:hypothetical protein